MNNLTWGAVILIALLLFKRNPRKYERQRGIGIFGLAYLSRSLRRNSNASTENTTLTYEQIESKRSRNAVFKAILLFIVIWVYAAMHGWGNGTQITVYASILTGIVCVLVRMWTDHHRNVVMPFYVTLCRMRNATWPMDQRASRWVTIPRAAARTGIPPLVAWFLTSGTVTFGRSEPLSEEERRKGKQRTVRTVRVIPMGMQAWLREHSGWADVLWPVGRASVGVRLPKDMNATGDLLTLIQRLVESRFPGQWVMQSNTRKFRLKFVPSKPIPSLVALPDHWIKTAKKSKEFAVPIGMVDDKTWSFIELESETPHTLVAGATGSGKTVTITMLIAWVLLHGGIVDVIDPKRVGFADHRKGKIDLRGLPNVRIHTDPESWEYVVTEYKQSMDRVYADLEAGADIDDRLTYPTRLLVIDEKGAYTRAMRSHWKRKGGKGIPPTFDFEDDILQQGRFARHFLAVGAQQANAYVLRSTDARFNYGAKIGAGPQDAMSWRMLFGGKRQPTPVLKGRGFWSNGAEPVPIQLTYITQEQVQRMAFTGDALRRQWLEERTAETLVYPPAGEAPWEAPTAPVGTVPVHRDTVPVPGETAASVPVQRDTEPAPDPVVLVGLAAAAEYLNTTIGALTAARKRNPIPGEMRQGNQPAWNVVDLREWHSKRPRAGAKPLDPTEVILSKEQDKASGE